MTNLGIIKNQIRGEDSQTEIHAAGGYLSLSHSVVGYSEPSTTAQSSVDITLNDSVHSVSMRDHSHYPSISVAEMELPAYRPLRVVAGEITECVYRMSELVEVQVDRSHAVDGDYDVILTNDAHLRLRQHSSSFANAFNAGASWSDVQAIIPDSVSVQIIKQDLIGYVKRKWGEMDTVPQGYVVSHDNGTTRGLWRAQTDTTAEPTKGHADWSLVFEITV